MICPRFSRLDFLPRCPTPLSPLNHANSTIKMPGSLHKARKQISKKRNGEFNALHEKSRDSLRLHKASVRDQRLEKLAIVRSKKEQPIFDRVIYFQQSMKERDTIPLDLATVQSLILSYIQRYEEDDPFKRARRPGRPSSTREDLLRTKISALKTEYQNGFALPDVIDLENAKLLEQWEGSWSQLTTLTWIKVTSTGHIRKSDFPSKSIN